MKGRVGEIARMSSYHCPLPSFHPHPDVRLCGDLLSTVQIHHLWRAVSQGRESLYLILTLPVAHLLWVHLTDVTTAIVTQHKDSLLGTDDVLYLYSTEHRVGRGSRGEERRVEWR